MHPTRPLLAIRRRALALAILASSLHRPELWKQVSMREDVINGDFIWRRDGEQIVGVLEGRTEEKRKGGPGTRTFMSNTGKEFFADAEWVLSPDTLWLYDINLLGGQQFIGRKDRTHNRLHRARPYRCSVADEGGRRLRPRRGTAPDAARAGCAAAARVGGRLSIAATPPRSGGWRRLQLQVAPPTPAQPIPGRGS